MSLKVKQDVLHFPVRKTKNSSRFQKQMKENVNACNQRDDRSFSNDFPNTKKSPRKEDEFIAYNQENIQSPSKKKCFNSPSKEDVLLLRKPFVMLERTPLEDLEQSLRSPNKEFQSPTKLHQTFDLHSPVRRSPRKLNFENSPSTLLSNLVFSPPKKIVQSTNAAIGICKPDLSCYKSLKASLSCNVEVKMVGRELETKALEDYLDKHLKRIIPGSLYISGAPGTGKTALVTKTVDKFKDVTFKTIFLNCMSTKTSREIFNSIAKSLRINTKKTEREIVRLIERNICSSKCPILIILDEVDQLESKNQDVLYTIFEWSSLADSKAVLVGVANMLDLTDRILPRLQANEICRPQLLHFPAYTKTEIVNIINDRIKEADVNQEIIKPSAIHFLAAKVSSVAGDIRKALDVCRRAVELCEMDHKKQSKLIDLTCATSSPSGLKKVEIPQILSIFNEVYGSRVTKEIVDNPSTFPLQQKVLICSLLLMLKNTKTRNVTLGKFHEVYSKVCVRQNLPNVEQSEFFSICSLLESRGMLQVKKSKDVRNSKVFLKLNEEEAEQALGDKVLLLNIMKDHVSLFSKIGRKNTL